MMYSCPIHIYYNISYNNIFHNVPDSCNISSRTRVGRHSGASAATPFLRCDWISARARLSAYDVYKNIIDLRLPARKKVGRGGDDRINYKYRRSSGIIIIMISNRLCTDSHWQTTRRDNLSADLACLYLPII